MTAAFDAVLLPHPLKNPPVDVADGGAIFGGSNGFVELVALVDFGTQASLALGRWPLLLAVATADPPPNIFRSESSLPFTSSNSCLATASAVFALTSSSSRASSEAGL